MIYVALDDLLSLYSFPEHPFNKQRYFAFKDALEKKGLIRYLKKVESREAKRDELLLFHTKEYIEFVKNKDKEGGYLDYGDTPAFEGIFRASSIIVGTTLNCIDKAIQENTKVFTPVGGLHHAYRDRASGFCVFNDICISINYLRKKYGIEKILYFDIDAHHGDGVYYSFIEDQDLYIVDFHQRGIFPGTGSKTEKGIGKASGTKLNIELTAGTTDEIFLGELKKIEEFLNTIKIEFILFQAGCDSLADDPITFLNLTERVHQGVTGILIEIADKQAKGRMVVFGGGGYSLSNIKKGWIAVIEELLKYEKVKERIF
ncbi:MAG: acetoin utilization protein AcuC [Candidatus Omnitrophica bacterium]|nr:acetoin utilization protein AcuC [Candidatus Omnitrophota bacterium]MCM8793085.1 acetoin utilization protein AcuC [Candidatus Omnitrophota bacterium]